MRLAVAAVASGWLVATTAAAPGWSTLAWFALVPLSWAIDGERPSKAFALGWLAGFACFLLEFDWIPGTITRATAVSPVSPMLAVTSLAAAAAFAALSFGAFAAALRFWQSRTARGGVVAAALFWVGVEWARSSFVLPCPWGLFGYALGDVRPLAQIADATGVFGLSALLVATNQAIYVAAFRRDARSVASLGLAAAAVLMAWTYGESTIADLARRPVAETLRVGMVQPSIDPNEKWDPAAREAVIAISETLSREAVADGAELLVWPEASAPYVFAEDELYARDGERFAADRAYRDRMVAFVRELGVPVLFGSAVIVPRPAGRGELWNSVNRSLLASPDGRVTASYDKTILVPFGEYVPWPRLLFFVEKLVPGVGDFIPGTGPTLFPARGARFAVVICYEAIFPDYVRRMVDGGAAFLVNQTNDAWFGDSGAPREHLASARLRAVENHVPLVRVANTGISALVDADGRILEPIGLGERRAAVVEVRLRPSPPTFYTRHGDVFAQTATLAALALLLYAGWMTAAPAPEAVAA